MSTFNEKLGISVNSALLFALVNLPQAYKVTSGLTSMKLIDLTSNCPTQQGIVLHTLVFFVITYLSMRKSKSDTAVKFKHSLYSTLIFYLVSSPATFSVVSSLLGKQFSDASGCATLQGILLHAAVYCVFLILVMYLPERNK